MAPTLGTKRKYNQSNEASGSKPANHNQSDEASGSKPANHNQSDEASGSKSANQDQSDEASGSKSAKGRLKPGRKPGQKTKAKPSLRKKMVYQPESWSVKEKEKLLAGLKEFAPSSIHSLARFVQTKTPEEVAAKIAVIRKSPAIPPQQLYLDESKERRAPLEEWLPVARDLVRQEPTDLSENLAEVIGIIGRTEVPRDSLSSKLNWKNIYQYISDMLANRVHLQSLTELESLVILDVMHSMADTLRNSETQEQRHLMNLKYKYLLADPLCFPQFATKDAMVAMAMSNDFASVENRASTSSSVTEPSCCPSSSVADPGEKDQSGTVPSSSSSSCSSSPSSDAQFKAGECDAAGSSSRKPPEETNAASEANAPSSSKTKHLTDASGASANVEDRAENGANGASSFSLEDDENSDQKTSKESPSNMAWTPESGYCRPRFYTMNPFCIPPHLLDFKLKKT